MKIEILKLLIEHGAEIDKQDNNMLTPFQVAVDLEEKECAIFLKSKGAKSIPPPGESE